jgi:hypothetical protein
MKAWQRLSQEVRFLWRCLSLRSISLALWVRDYEKHE